MQNDYFESLDHKIQEYYAVLEPIFPEWLFDYINTPAIQHQKYISTTCGTIYSDLYPDQHFFYSSLDHSIGVALIVWHFTHDKKQTLAGLFHDIATPAFKHCVDFLNGDYMTQESTEDLTTYIIEHSPEIMALLKRDNIAVSEVDNYHLYPIADNDTPQLSADRLEYSLSNGALVYQETDIAGIKRFYRNIVVGTDEKGRPELSFKNKSVARDFVKMTSKLSVVYRDERTRFSMQFIADILKSLSVDGKITKSDLYTMKESEIIDLIQKSEYADVWKKWSKATQIQISDIKPDGIYYVHHGAKIRYIDPLIEESRISKLEKSAANAIRNNLDYKMDAFIHLNFAFEPHQETASLKSSLADEDSAEPAVSNNPALAPEI